VQNYTLYVYAQRAASVEAIQVVVADASRARAMAERMLTESSRRVAIEVTQMGRNLFTVQPRPLGEPD